MYEWFKFFHLGAGIVWLGGMASVILALRPMVMAQMAPPERLTLMSGVLSRFFVMVWISIALLLASGFWMLSMTDMKLAPKGWHAMSGLGLLMCLIFAHIWFAPFRKLKAAVLAADWPAAGKALGQIHPLVVTNFVLGWLAVLAVVVWR
ncbi:CopD family protein [Limnohabitans sp. Rim47]|uniref:CopD family protein n=1 Tax=Limnohabitans sp. Rim47 TaxID=1100721 RepID=UPI00030692DC|nr:CopD family protein [Limnohabitans sp. Rim47]